MEPEWYEINDIEELDSPVLTIHKNMVRFNIDKMVEMTGDPGRLRPHVKTYKIKEVVKMQMRSGITNFKCATIAEAEMLAIAGVKDILLAYQPTGPKIERFLSLVQNYTDIHFSCLIDNQESAELIASRNVGVLNVLDIYIDLNNGNDRTGIHPDEALPLFKRCLELKGIRPVGLHVYDGHIRESDPEKRKNICDRDFEKVRNLAEYIREKFAIDPIIIAGGSPTFGIHAKRKDVICSPGTTLFWDAGYHEKFPDLPFRPAAVLVSRVISKPAEGLICLDLGHKSVAGENPIENRARFLNVNGLSPVSHSEEHFVLKNTSNADLKVGDVLYAVPYHICPTTALYNEVKVIEKNRVTATWEVLARGRKISV